MKKLLVTISREHGTDGKEAAHLIADRLGIPFYDNDEIIKKVDNEDCREFYARTQGQTEAEKRYSGITTFLGSGSRKTEKLFNEQSQAICRLGESRSGVFVGRCADHILKGYSGLVTVFLYGDIETRTKHVMRDTGLDERAAAALIKEMDKNRASYYSFNTNNKWGEKSNYNLCIDAGGLDADDIADIIMLYIEKRFKNR